MSNLPGDPAGEQPPADPGASGSPKTGSEAPDQGAFGSGDPKGSDVGSDAVIDGLDAELVDLINGEVSGSGEPNPASEGTVEEAPLTDLERVTQERDDYLDGFRRLQAEFENYKKAIGKREADARSRANDALVSELLPVLDACALAMANPAEGSNPEDIGRIQAALLDALTRQGLEVLDPAGEPFDPEQHEAVMHEEDDGSDGLKVAEVLRTGYGWKGHVIRPAMVKTRG